MLAAWGTLSASAQTDRLPDIRLPFPPDSTQLEVRTTNLPDIKELHYPTIDGAPVLKQPVRIDGSRREIRTEEHGLAYPTLFDWNRDGKPDLLVGEFLTGQSRIKVYLNKETQIPGRIVLRHRRQRRCHLQLPMVLHRHPPANR